MRETVKSPVKTTVKYSEGQRQESDEFQILQFGSPSACYAMGHAMHHKTGKDRPCIAS